MSDFQKRIGGGDFIKVNIYLYAWMINYQEFEFKNHRVKNSNELKHFGRWIVTWNYFEQIANWIWTFGIQMHSSLGEPSAYDLNGKGVSVAHW